MEMVPQKCCDTMRGTFFPVARSTPAGPNEPCWLPERVRRDCAGLNENEAWSENSVWPWTNLGYQDETWAEFAIRSEKVGSGAMNIKKLDLLKIRNLKFRASQRQVVIDRLLRKKKPSNQSQP